MSSTTAALAGCATALLAALSACGSSDNGEAAKSPEQILADVRSAVAQLHSFHFTAAITEKTGPTTADGDVALPGRMHITLRQSDGVAEVIYAGGKAFLRANRQ